LRAARPEVRIVFGGAACLGSPADELVRAFPFIDAVCHTEGDQIIVPLIRALGRRGDAWSREALAAIPGMSWVDGNGRVHHNPSPPLLMDMDVLPVPDYDDFVRQLADSPFRERAKLHFETSRGCWWGQKHL